MLMKVHNDDDIFCSSQKQSIKNIIQIKNVDLCKLKIRGAEQKIYQK